MTEKVTEEQLDKVIEHAIPDLTEDEFNGLVEFVDKRLDNKICLTEEIRSYAVAFNRYQAQQEFVEGFPNPELVAGMYHCLRGLRHALTMYDDLYNDKTKH